MTDLPRERTCPVCDASPTSVRDSDPPKKDMLGGRLRLATCDGCKTVFQPLRPTDEELANWYRYMGELPANYALTPLIERRLGRIVRKFEGVRQTNRLLEVGCGGGLLLNVAERFGWEVYGTEISPSLCSLLRPRFGERLWQGDLSEAPFAKVSFDVVVLMEIIEHLTSPLEYVAAVRKLLRPGGLFFLTTPNYAGLSSRVLEDRWRAVGDEHLNYFDPSTIAQLLHRGGFRNVEIATTNLDSSLVRELVPKLRARPEAPDVARSVDASPAPKPSTSPVTPPAAAPGAKARTSAWAKDVAIEGVNRLLVFMRIGDTMKVVATAEGTS